MPHPLVLALYDDVEAAARGARAVHALDVDREHLSVVARSHDEEGQLADAFGATPGADIEDSRAASRLGELSAHVLAAIAVVLPGIGPIVAAGPLAAGMGEAAGHVAGGIGSILSDAGIERARAESWERRIESGALLLGAHVIDGDPYAVRDALAASGAKDVEVAKWD
jgi:hypothetical protein